MPEPGHVDVNVTVTYSGLIQVNAHTEQHNQATCQSDVLILVFFFFFPLLRQSWPLLTVKPLYISHCSETSAATFPRKN